MEWIIYLAGLERNKIERWSDINIDYDIMQIV